MIIICFYFLFLRKKYCYLGNVIIIFPFFLKTVQVVHEDQDEKIVCRVNDCDATSQVKAKLLDAVYKNTPFSARPSLHDVDLGKCYTPLSIEPVHYNTNIPICLCNINYMQLEGFFNCI